MKKVHLLLILFATSLALTSVASTGYHPPGSEKVKTELVSKMKNEPVAAAIAVAATIEHTILTGNTPEAEPVSIIACPAVSFGETELVLHDFGNSLYSIRVSKNKQFSNTLLFERLYLSNCSINQCSC